MDDNVTELLEAAKNVLGVADNASFQSGVCCCGSGMEKHDDFGAGHGAVDSGEHYGGIALERLRLAVERLAT